MSELRKKVSKILGYGIYPDEWDEAFEVLDKEHRISQKQIIEILKELLKREEERELKADE